MGQVEVGWGKDMGVVAVVSEGSGMRCLDRMGGNGWVGLWGRQGRGEGGEGGRGFILKFVQKS